MDLGMPVEDFIEFEKIVEKELPENMGYLPLMFYGGKIHNKNTTYIESSDILNYQKWHGVFIDIVPLVAVPDDELERKKYSKELFEFHTEARKYERYPNHCLHSCEEMKKWRNSLMLRYKYGATEYVTDFSFGAFYVFKTKGFLEPLQKTIRGVDILISSTYDDDLKSRYGEYKKIPDGDLLWNHEAKSYVDLKRPYREYHEEFEDCKKWIVDIFKGSNVQEGDFYQDLTNRIICDIEKEEKQAMAEKGLTNSYEYRLGRILLAVPRKIHRAFSKKKASQKRR